MIERILVVKLADLGDTLTATPALRALRLRYPKAAITALVTPHTASLLEANDAIDTVIPFQKAPFDDPRGWRSPRAVVEAVGALAPLAWRLRRDRFDAVVLLHHLVTRWGTAKYRALVQATGAPLRVGLDNGAGTFLNRRAADNGFGARHEVDYWLDVVATLDASHPEPRLELALRPAETMVADRRWAALRLAHDQVVALHPGSGAFSVARRWAPERFAAVGDALAAAGRRIVVVGGPGEEPLVAAVCGAMRAPATALQDCRTPRELAGILRRCRLFVGNDSGVMHIAAAMGVPVVAVFGLSNHRAWGPYPVSSHRVVRLDLPCSPCFYVGHRLGTPQGCADHSCLVDLQPDLVVASARELLEATQASTPGCTPAGPGTRSE
jgi:heptosyltransferase-2